MLPPLPGDVPPTIFVPYAMAASEWKVPFLPVKPWQMTLVFLPIRMDMRSNTFAGSAMRRDYFTGLLGAFVDAGEHVVPAFGVGRELDLHVVGVVVDDLVEVTGVAAQRAAHEDQRVRGPAAGGG